MLSTARETGRKSTVTPESEVGAQARRFRSGSGRRDLSLAIDGTRAMSALGVAHRNPE